MKKCKSCKAEVFKKGLCRGHFGIEVAKFCAKGGEVESPCKDCWYDHHPSKCPKLKCEIHNRILIGKKKCIDCSVKPMQKLIKQILKHGHPIQRLLDKSFSGSCPCFSARLKINGHYLNLYGHCWRSCSGMDKSKWCEFNGLHIKTKLTKKEIAPLIKAIVKELDEQEWYSKWKVVYE